MKIYRRDAFLKLPPGTIYAQGRTWHFGTLAVKGDTIGDDWSCLNPMWIEATDDGDQWAMLNAMLEGDASVPMETSYGRDGCFDIDALFLVAERDDLVKLRDVIDAALHIDMEANNGSR